MMDWQRHTRDGSDEFRVRFELELRIGLKGF
jgi:hypothetical protein